jgi:hypothetical protein
MPNELKAKAFLRPGPVEWRALMRKFLQRLTISSNCFFVPRNGALAASEN